GIRDRNVTGVQTCALPIYSINSYKRRIILLKRNTLGFKILLSTIAIAFVVLNSMIPLQASANSVNGLENQLGDMANTYEETTKEVTEDIQNEYTEKAKQLIETGQVDIITLNNMESDNI